MSIKMELIIGGPQVTEWSTKLLPGALILEKPGGEYIALYPTYPCSMLSIELISADGQIRITEQSSTDLESGNG